MEIHFGVHLVGGGSVAHLVWRGRRKRDWGKLWLSRPGKCNPLGKKTNLILVGRQDYKEQVNTKHKGAQLSVVTNQGKFLLITGEDNNLNEKCLPMINYACHAELKGESWISGWSPSLRSFTSNPETQVATEQV